MTAITAASLPVTASVTAISPVTSVPEATSLNTSAATTSTSPASVVSLGQATATAVDTQLYSSRGTLADAPPAQIWANATQNKVTTTMAANLYSQATADRFRGLGAALLTQVASSGSGYSQSVIQPSGTSTPSASALAALQSNLSTHADNSINLTIKTASGATVTVSLSSNGDGLAAQVDVSGGKLSDSELAAIGKLADSFQAAIDGLSAKPPKLALDGLADFDKSVLKSIDMSAQLKGGDVQSLSFQADAKQRSISLGSIAGDLQLSVDTRSAVIGTAAQQAKAVQAYLEQFDAARKRGQGDETLMGLFKDAFTGLNSHLETAAPTAGTPVLSDTDQALLSGLADFSASLTQHAQSVNPMRVNEVDTFAYSASQSSRVSGSQANRVVEQQQQSHLSASYHQSLYPGTSLALGTDPSTQNYSYHQIEDSFNSSARTAYHKGELIEATLANSSSQSSTTLTYAQGELQSKEVTPKHSSASSNMLGVLQTALEQDKDTGFGSNGPAYQRVLDGIRAQVLAALAAVA